MVDRFKTPADIRNAEKALAEVDPQIAELIKQHGPCQITPWEYDLFTALISSIVSQQLSTKAARTIFERVKTASGADKVINPAKLHELPKDELRKCGLSESKSRFVSGLAEATVTKSLNFEAMTTMTDEEITELLLPHAGVGPWTVEMFLIFAMGSPDVLSTADLGLKRGMQRYLELTDYPETKVFTSAAEKWRPYRSIACWYLWRLAE